MAAPSDGTVKSHQKISDTEGGFTGPILDDDRFGISSASLGDLDGDGVSDLAVGANGNDGEGRDRGAVWILFMNTDGTVKAEQEISDMKGGFSGTLSDDDEFGTGTISEPNVDEQIQVRAYGGAGGGAKKSEEALLNESVNLYRVIHDLLSSIKNETVGTDRIKSATQASKIDVRDEDKWPYRLGIWNFKFRNS